MSLFRECAFLGSSRAATVAADLFKQAMEEAGYTSQRQLAPATYIKLSQLARRFRAGASPPTYADLETEKFKSDETAEQSEITNS